VKPPGRKTIVVDAETIRATSQPDALISLARAEIEAEMLRLGEAISRWLARKGKP